MRTKCIDDGNFVKSALALLGQMVADRSSSLNLVKDQPYIVMAYIDTDQPYIVMAYIVKEQPFAPVLPVNTTAPANTSTAASMMGPRSASTMCTTRHWARPAGSTQGYDCIGHHCIGDYCNCRGHSCTRQGGQPEAITVRGMTV